ncbi:MAG: CrcB family protein [Nocardioidaceae bacterium]|nr:CrcB family protein [Nocardioidaceae bacterium]
MRAGRPLRQASSADRAPRPRNVRAHADVVAVVAVGGALGSLARWAVGLGLGATGGEFPWATFVANVSGAFALGVLMVFVLGVWSPSRYVRPFFGAGILSGYTTFSTYMLDTHSLVVADRVALAAVYLFATLIAGLAAVWIGVVLARWISASPPAPGTSS